MSGKLCVATIRNPFDRLVSFWMQRGYDVDFGEYIDRLVSKKENWYGVKPQTNWLSSSIIPGGAFILLRYERFEHYVMYFLGKFGYKMPRSIPWMRRTKGREGDYREYYSNKQRKLVASFYRKDLNLLGYRF